MNGTNGHEGSEAMTISEVPPSPWSTTETNDDAPTEASTPSAGPAVRSRRRWATVVAGLVTVVGIAAVFAAGYIVKDDGKAEQDELRARVATLTTERAELADELDAAKADLDDVNGLVSECRNVADGYAEYVTSADDFMNDSDELVLAIYDWWLAEPGSGAEADAQAHLDQISEHMDEQREQMQRDAGALRSQADGCLD
jgi:hypothetical protein